MRAVKNQAFTVAAMVNANADVCKQGYNTHSSFYGIGDKQTSGSINLLILLLDVLGNFL